MNNNNDKFRLTLLDSVNVCLQSFGDHVMHVLFSPQHALDVERFRVALRRSVEAEPILACRLVYSRWKPFWQRWDDATLDAHAWCDLVEAGDVDQQIQTCFLQTMDCCTEPMVKAWLIRGTTDTLCLNVNCVPIDGRGLFIYLERLFDIYNRLATEPDYQPAASAMDARSTRHLVPHFRWYDPFKLLFHGLRNQWTDRRTAHNWKFPCGEHRELDRVFQYRQFQPATLATLNAFRSGRGFSFNDLVLAAFYDALHDIIRPPRENTFCVLNTYDLRRYEPAGAVERVANYSSFVNSNVAVNAALPFPDLVQRVHSAMTERKQHYPGITEGPFIWPIFQLLPFGLARFVVEKLLHHRGESIPVMTNVGVVAIDRMILDGERIRYLVPFAPLEYPPKLTVTVATVGDVITLSVGYSRNHFREQDITQLFAHVEHTLSRLELQDMNP